LTPQPHTSEGHGLNITLYTLRRVMFVVWYNNW